MKSFSEYLEEAYNFLPKSREDILNAPLKNAEKIAKAFDYVMKAQKGDKMEDPFAIDMSKPNSIKIHRSLEGDVDPAEMKKMFGLSFSFGTGSRGNVGAGNQGNAFEKRLSKDLGQFVQTRDPEDPEFEYPKFMKDFATKHLMDEKNIMILDEGGLNKKRPLQYKNGRLAIESPRIQDIGKTVTDITIDASKENLYLSLKLGSTVTFFNIGVSKYLTATDLKNNKVNNQIGAAILDLFGIDHQRYLDTFNKYDKNAAPDKNGAQLVDVTRKVSMPKLVHFLATGVGYGYFLVHAKNAKPGSDIHWFEMTRAELPSHVYPTSVKVRYPKEGTAKRIDIVIETKTFTFKVNIRNKQGGVAPSHIMCDYSIKH
jgi:hypothetical protein